MYWRDTFDENIRNGIFALLILQVLSEGDKERRELHREIGVRTDGSFCKTDSLYMTIHKLLLQKMITYSILPTDDAYRETIYHIEGPGKDYLAYGKSRLKTVLQALQLFFGQEMTLDEINERPLS